MNVFTYIVIVNVFLFCVLFQNFETGGELVIHYGYQEAWG